MYIQYVHMYIILCLYVCTFMRTYYMWVCEYVLYVLIVCMYVRTYICT